MFDLLS